MKDIKWLVRELTIETEGETRFLPLSYLTGQLSGTVLREMVTFPFDKERPGFEYLNKVTIKKNGYVKME